MTIQAPVSLLLDPDLSPSAKLVWLVRRIHAEQNQMQLAALEEHANLARNTVVKALIDLTAHGWYAGGAAIDRAQATACVPVPTACVPVPTACVPVPTALLADDRLKAHGRLLYGLLQLTPAFNNPEGQFTYPQLSRLTGTSIPTLRKGFRRLADTGWLETSQDSKVAPFHFTLCNPVVRQREAEVARADQRIKRGFAGETLMREFLSALVASDQFQDNAAPGFLINPLTDARMQLDRFYPPNIAFEFNGPQHEQATDRFSEEIVAQQKSRDLMKQGHCVRQGITLVIVHAEDLSLDMMRQKIPHLLPLRDLTGHEQLIAFLEAEARRYRRTNKDPHWLK